MKPTWLIVLSGISTVIFALWMIDQGRDDREIWIALGAWLLGFWFASSLLSERNAEEGVTDDADEPEEEDDDTDPE